MDEVAYMEITATSTVRGYPRWFGEKHEINALSVSWEDANSPNSPRHKDIVLVCNDQVILSPSHYLSHKSITHSP